MTESEPQTEQRGWLSRAVRLVLEYFRPIGAVATTIVLLVTEVWVAFKISSAPEQRGLSLMLIAAGVALGWLLGTLASPYDESERAEFRALAVSAFLSGYLLAKIDPLLVALLKPETAADPLHAFRLLSFATTTVVAALMTFVGRRYPDDTEEEDAGDADTPARGPS
jgi:hypothetical protein